MTGIVGHRGLLLAGAGDPYASQLAMLLNMAGADGSQVFIDSAPVPHPMTAYGNAQIDNSQGYSVGLFDGAGDYVTTPYVKADFDWWTQDHTIEAWINPANLSTWAYTDGASVPAMIGCANPATTTCYWSFGPRNDGRLVFNYFDGVARRIVAAGSVSANTLSHIAMCKSSSGIRLAVNGALEAPVTIPGTPLAIAGSGVVLTLGMINGRSINGAVRAIRITKGVARYTGNFIPPPAPFPVP